MKTPNSQSVLQTWNSGTPWGETHTSFGATTKTEAGSKLVGLKIFRNWKFKQAVGSCFCLGRGEEDFVKQFRRL